MVDLATHPFRPLEDAERVAAAVIADDRNDRVVMPAPPDKKPNRYTFGGHAPAGTKFVKAWVYRDRDGAPLYYVARFERPDGSKDIRPFCLVERGDRLQVWVPMAAPGPRAIYNLDKIAARPDALVLVVEGEKAADEVERLFPDFVVTTSSGGAGAAAKADWTPLKGRSVVIWPDADEPGRRYAADATRLAHAAGAVSVRIVAVSDRFPAGWDLADDPAAAGLTPTDIRRMVEQAPLVDARTVAQEPRAPAPACEGKAAAVSEWQAPLPIVSALPPVPPFEPALLPEGLRGYVVDVADRQQAPPDFAAVVALCGLAAVLGNKVRIAPKQHDDWIVTPNLWGAIIGRPSAMKSPALQSALAPVYALQDDMRRAWEEEQKDRRADEALAKLDSKDARKRAEKHLKDGDRDAAKSALIGSGGADDDPPCRRLVVNDATVEKLGELLNENPSGLLLIRDELPGFLARIESEEFQEERAFYLEAFNGDGRFTYDRIGRGTVHIENCTLSLVGGVQPSRIAPLIRGAITGATNDGLIQRLQMTVWPDDVAEWRWVDRSPAALARIDYDRAFADLRELNLGGDDGKATLRFTPDAQAMFREWMEEIQAEARSGGLPSVMESHVLKMPKTIASLALIFELVEGGRAAVSAEATARALGWADYLRAHATRLYAAGDTLAEDGARTIVKRRAQLAAPFTARDVYRKQWAGLSDRDAVSLALEVLVATHHCREVAEAPGPQGGRATSAFHWNPLLTAGG